MLELSNVVSINVALAPMGLGEYNVNNIAYFASEPFLSNPNSDDYRVYVSPADVAADFGSNSEAYAQANAIFAQNPNILAGGGNLIIFPMLSITAGGLKTISIHTVGSGYSVDDVLTIVQAGGASGTAEVLAVDDDGEVLEVEIKTVGTGYQVADDLPTTVSPNVGSGCTLNIDAIGTGAETLIDAILRTKDMIFYCGIISDSYPASGDMKTLADYVQGLGDKILFLPSNTSGDIAGAFTAIWNASDYATRCFYNTVDAATARLFAAAYAGRAMSVNFDGSRTTMTMHFKSLTTIEPDEGITQTILTALGTAGVDAYVDIAGIPMVFSEGANRFFDDVYNLIWLVSQLKVNGFNALRELNTKIPQTEPGMSLLKGAYRLAMEQAVTNGYVAPGQWNSSEWFGVQEDMNNNVLERGYYIYSQPVNLQSQADRVARKAPLVQIALKEAGAIHKTDVIVNINQ